MIFFGGGGEGGLLIPPNSSFFPLKCMTEHFSGKNEEIGVIKSIMYKSLPNQN